MTSILRDGQIEFTFFRANVRSVKLVGDFNSGGPRALAMESKGDGWWTTRMKFDAGDYRFRYEADGAWYPDYAANGVEMTREGFSSILIVPNIKGETHSTSRSRLPELYRLAGPNPDRPAVSQNPRFLLRQGCTDTNPPPCSPYFIFSGHLEEHQARARLW